MASRTPDASRRWVDQGTILFGESMARVDDATLAEQTALTGWTGRHLLAHVAANADALLNLVHWAATGQETPMYSSPQQRGRDIESGAQLPPTELRRRVAETAGELAVRMLALTTANWSVEVRTAQGRLVPATEIPWMRARELMVHAVDLDPSRKFEDLPEDFLIALVDDVVGRRSTGEQPSLSITSSNGPAWQIAGRGAPVRVSGSLAGVASYLTGRGGTDVAGPAGEAAPDLPEWL